MDTGLKRWITAFAWLFAFSVSVATASAASLDNIEIDSRLNEKLYAEVPVHLEAGEEPSKVLVEVASAGDYRVFEVFRESVVDAIRVDVTSDKRGTRVVLTSASAMQTPLFNLVLKMRYGRVSQFKKYAVVLEPVSSMEQAAVKAPKPVVEAAQGERVSAVVEPLSAAEPVASETAKATAEPQYFDGWARTNRYGPIVRGDSLSTVAERLRVDKRFTMSQVMVALFEKNRSRFDQGNLNLMKAGSFLDVPTADEVGKSSPAQAHATFAEHDKRWKELTEQPRYAAEAEAQRTRYSSRVGMGEIAGGSAGTQMTAVTAEQAVVPADAQTPAATARPEAPAVSEVTTATDAATAVSQSAEEAAAAAAEDRKLLEALQQQNETLQQKLAASDDKIAALSEKIDRLIAASKTGADTNQLELLLSQRLKEIESERSETTGGGSDTLTWILIALIGLLSGVVATLLVRRQPAPAVPASSPETTMPLQPENKIESIADAATGSETESLTQPAEAEPDVFESIDSFGDETADSDSDELAGFDPSLLDEEPDPDTDYLSEAEIYIRYGMLDEALHQVEMALRLDESNADAHLKKADLLHRKEDEGALETAVNTANSTLSGDALAHYLNGVEALAEGEAADDTDALIADEEVGEESEADLDFELTMGDLAGLAESEQADSENDSALQASDEEELDWLREDTLVEPLDQLAEESKTAAESAGGDESSTRMLDHLIDEFGTEGESSELEFTSSGTTESAGDTVAMELPDSRSELSETDSGQQMEELLSEFDAGDEDIFGDTVVVESAGLGLADAGIVEPGDELSTVEHLDHLMDEFAADESDDFDVLTPELTEDIDIDVSADAAAFEREATAPEDATMQLGGLLSEFSADDADVDIADKVDGAIQIDAPGHDATQELNALLDEFSFAEEGSESIAADAAEDEQQEAIEELNQLLGEFSNDEDKDEHKPG